MTKTQTILLQLYGPCAFSCTQPLDLDQFSSAKELEAQGAELLKLTLQQLGLKCGGTVEERAQRLFLVKGKNKDEIDRSLLAKPNRGRGKGKRMAQTSHP